MKKFSPITTSIIDRGARNLYNALVADEPQEKVQEIVDQINDRIAMLQLKGYALEMSKDGVLLKCGEYGSVNLQSNKTRDARAFAINLLNNLSASRESAPSIGIGF